MNGLLQLIFYAILCVLLIWVTGRSTAALAGLGTVFVVGFFSLAQTPVLPVYVNSLSYAAGGWAPLLAGTGILTGAIIVVATILALFIRRRGFAT